MHRAQKPRLRPVARPVPRHADLPAACQGEARNVQRVGTGVLAAHAAHAAALDVAAGRSRRDAAPSDPGCRASASRSRLHVMGEPQRQRRRQLACHAVDRQRARRRPPSGARRCIQPQPFLRARPAREVACDPRRAQDAVRTRIRIRLEPRQPPVDEPGIGLGQVDGRQRIPGRRQQLWRSDSAGRGSSQR